MTKRVLTGIKPTGIVHLGNYIGAIKPAIKLINDARDCFLFVADYHALNAVRNAAELKEAGYRVAATYLAFGLDLEKTVFYRQSDIPQIFELSTILAAVTPKGLMNRAHAYKAMLDKNAAAGKRDLDDGVNMGLYTYPILMAADILVAKADTIPVGKDQVQHIEMARDMAGSFNHLFGETLVLPEFSIQKNTGVVPGLDSRKMSKSYNNIIPLFETPKNRQKLIMKIVTDSKLPEEPKDPDQSTIFQLYTHFANKDEIAEMERAFKEGGMGYGDAKKLLAEAVNRTLEEPNAAFDEWMADLSKIDAVLEEGAEKARAVAAETLRDVRRAIGVKA